MNKLKLIGIDLDGTLLNSKKQITPYTKEVLQECVKKGIKVYFVSGRPYSFVKQLAREVDEQVQVIASNGGYFEYKGIEKESYIESKSLHRIIDLLSKYEIKAYFKSKKAIYTHESYDKRFMYDHVNDQFDEDLKVSSICELSWDQLKKNIHDILKILIYEENSEKLCILEQQIREECLVEIVNFRNINIDITAQNTTKGVALQQVMIAYGIDSQDVMTIGDSDNDLPMLQTSGIKVAMKNALPHIKSYCDFVCDDNDHDGVGKAIVDYLNN